MHFAQPLGTGLVSGRGQMRVRSLGRSWVRGCTWAAPSGFVQSQTRGASVPRHGTQEGGQEKNIIGKGEKEIYSRFAVQGDAPASISSTIAHSKAPARGVGRLARARACHSHSSSRQHRDFHIRGLHHLRGSRYNPIDPSTPPLASPLSQCHFFSTTSRIESRNKSPASTIRSKMSDLASAGFQAVIRAPAQKHGQPEEAELKAHHLKGGKGFRNPWESFEDHSFAFIMKNIFWWVGFSIF